MASHSDNWSKMIGEVFDTRPRVAIDDRARWMDRSEEKQFRHSVVCPGVHVCLYGPSGSGKTSLAKTVLGRLARKGTKFVYTKLNHHSDWTSFKSQILENKGAKAAAEKRVGVKIGLKNLLPYLEVDGEIGGGTLGAVLSRKEVVDAIGISEVSQYLVDSDLVLAIDDANFASDELLSTLASLAKEITDNSAGSFAKIVFIGADDIFSRIIALEDSLRDRTDEVALGSVRGLLEARSGVSADGVWQFIASGLSQLDLTDPRQDKLLTATERRECVEWINYAADGLPKSIVTLGRRIALLGERRKRVSYSDIKSESSAMVLRNYRNYRSKYRALLELLFKNDIVQEVCLWMFRHGASRIHTLDGLSEDLRELATYTMFDEALQLLAKKDFLTITGAGGNVFFARDPLLAHTLGVALLKPEKCGIDPGRLGGDAKFGQLYLRFSGKKDPENREKI